MQRGKEPVTKTQMLSCATSLSCLLMKFENPLSGNSYKLQWFVISAQHSSKHAVNIFTIAKNSSVALTAQ